MRKFGDAHCRASRVALALAAIILAELPAVAWALPGYANLINSYCRAQGATRVTYTDNGCTLCHHPGTFVSNPAHRVEPQWSEFELGRSAGGDYSFYCPPSGSAPQLVLDAPSSSGSGVDSGPALDSSVHASMSWMSLGYPSGHPATVTAQSESAPPIGAAEAAPRVLAPTPPETKAGATTDALAPLRLEPGLAADRQSKLATLRADLGLAEAQEGAWQELVEAVLAVGPLPKATTRASSAAQLESQLQEQQRRLAQRTAQLRLVNTALVRLNAQLEERQQRLLAAQLLALIADLEP